MNLSCLLNPVSCASGAFWGWYHGIDPMWFLFAGLAIGLLLGAWLGKWGVVAVLSLGVAALFLRKGGSEQPIEQFPEGHPDTQAPHRNKPIVKGGDDFLKRIFNGNKR